MLEPFVTDYHFLTLHSCHTLMASTKSHGIYIFTPLLWCLHSFRGLYDNANF